MYASWGWYGNHYVWTQIPPVGAVRTRTGTVKYPFWRLRSGRLTLAGHLLDAARPRLQVDIPDGYGPIGFQATELIFHASGCWRIWATMRGKGISFVLRVS